MNKDEEVRIMILSAARRVFQKWGLNKTTMEDIAREAGKGKSTLYYYFKSKEDIFEIIALEEIESITHKARRVMSQISSAKEKLKSYITISMTEIKQTVNLYPIVRGEINGNKEFIDKISSRIDKQDEIMIAEILKQGIESGEMGFVDINNIDKAASVINGILKSLINYLIFENDDSVKMDIALKLITEGM